jgi:hypothetical protein
MSIFSYYADAMRTPNSGGGSRKFQAPEEPFFAAMDFIILPIISKSRKLNYW